MIMELNLSWLPVWIEVGWRMHQRNRELMGDWSERRTVNIYLVSFASVIPFSSDIVQSTM